MGPTVRENGHHPTTHISILLFEFTRSECQLYYTPIIWLCYTYHALSIPRPDMAMRTCSRICTFFFFFSFVVLFLLYVHTYYYYYYLQYTNNNKNNNNENNANEYDNRIILIFRIDNSSITIYLISILR